MWSHQHIIVCTALSFVISAEGLIQVFGYEGRGVNFSCRYDQGYENSEKYFCKKDCGSSDVLITTKQKNKGKYSMTDDIKIRLVTVTISDLQSHDAGKYKCGVTRWFIDTYSEVKLQIKEDRCCDTVNKTQSIEEGSVTISCPYDSQSVDKLKFLCRGNRPSTCRQQAVITSSNTQNGRFRLSDDRKSRIFTVTISSLTLKDSGSYLCGVQRNSGFDDFSAVELEVKAKLFCLKSYHISGIEGRPVTLQCPNSGQHDNKKFLCKGDQHNNFTDMMENQTKFKLLNVSSICFSVIITELEAADAGTYYCGSDSQLRFIKIQLAVVSSHETSSVSPISSAEQVTSQPPSLSPSSHNPDVSLFYILPAVFALLLILTFVLLLVLKYKTRIKQVDRINTNVLNSADNNVEMRINDIYELQEDAVYMNSSTPNMLSHDNDIYNSVL
ncbi:polymeric immunoglobulin receptor-like isoform X2 [Xiphophorus hellerii]|uniref:polymeric immunoglobulin receptor-like isoform X2 n=1 Tax=Xiphophorus hellerii TaxID=8084 RepID=UPI0013B3DE80|nr:polymeric immunoglobulin receptor-like isoform X2 [Xiphophorus hellerii]